MAPLKHESPTPTVVLVGRTNVGKSALFNRLARGRRALVSPIPGTTRDYQEATVTWKAFVFAIVDTGVLDVSNDQTGIPPKILAQAEQSLKRASLVVFVTDVRDGILPGDRTIAYYLRKHKSSIILAVNKSESPRTRLGVGEFWNLGLGEPIAISALKGTGTGNLLDRITEELKKIGFEPQEAAEVTPLKIAIIGRPNVGKSTLVNAIVGYERVIVSPYAHTTREPIDTIIIWEGEPILIIDTAGIRKKARVAHGLEETGVKRSLEALMRADVALLVLDLTEGVNDQDKTLVGLIEEKGVGLVLVGNKWDLVRSDRSRPVITITTDLGAHWRRYIYGKFPFLSWAPIIFTSALYRDHIQALLNEAIKTGQARAQKLPEEEVLSFIQQAIARRSLPHLGPGKIRARFVSFAQTGTRPPAFELTVQTKEQFPDQYIRYLENELRRRFDFTGTPIRVTVRALR